MIMYIKHFICVDINCNSIKHKQKIFWEKCDMQIVFTYKTTQNDKCTMEKVVFI